MVIDSIHGQAVQVVPGTGRQFFAGHIAGRQGFVTVELATNGVPLHLHIRRLPDGVALTSRAILPVPEEFRSDRALELPCLASSPDGQWFTMAKPDREQVVDLHVFSLAAGRFVTRLPGRPRMSPRCLRISPDSRWLVRLDDLNNGDKWITIHDSQTWGPPRTVHFQSAGADVMFATIAPASRRLATGGLLEDSLRIWDLGTGRLVTRCHSGNLNWHPVWSPDSRSLVVRDGAALRFWSMVVFRELAAFPEHTDLTQQALGFTQDGRTLVTRTREERVKTWTPPALAETDRGP